ncbi:MAG: YceI family protein [Gammaproteobacteria bacterium]|nr:YceI family protein [Gammaproteobacteria bacterium]
MRKTILGFLLATLPVASMAASYQLDPTHTYPNFTINHLGFSTMNGTFLETAGSFEMDQDKGTGSVQVTIKADSIFTGFKKRDDHLRSPDFFNVGEFPEITFKSTSVKFSGKDKATVNGKLTIMGVTKDVTLDVDAIHCGPHPFNKKETCGFNATTSVMRSDFGIKYGVPAIGDHVSIRLEAEGVLQ